MRADTRKDTAVRKISIASNYIKYAEGSCLFEIGDTKVICTASVQDGVPLFMRGKGTGWVTAEYALLPRSCKTRVPREVSKGKLQGRTQEIQRLIGRCMRAVCDYSKLGERTIWMDCDVIQADGGTRCASISGSFIALMLALKQLKKDGRIDEIPVSDYVAAISVGIVKGKEVLDLSYDEDSSALVDMNVVKTGSGEFIEIQGTAEGKPFSHAQMETMIALAGKGIKEVIKAQAEIIGDLL